MEELKDIIKEIQGYKTYLNLKNLSDDMILDCSTRIFNSGKITESKKESNEELATDKQKYFLQKIGKYKEGLTKKEASIIIKEIKERGQDGRGENKFRKYKQ